MKTPFSFSSPKIIEAKPTIYDATKAPFRLHGILPPVEGKPFMRMPEDIARKTSERVGILQTNTAGARLRFATDSTFIAVGARYPEVIFPSDRTAALSGAGAHSFDLYADGEHIRVLWHERLIQRGSGVSFDFSDERYEAIAPLGGKRMREITLFFPAFTNVSELYIGLEEGASLLPATPYVNHTPVVFYGSSITQGACASRAGNSYPSILSRKFHFDYINLGFASACHAEDVIIDYLCALPASLLVFDYDHNAPSVEYLKSTHLPALRKLRAAHPDIPIVLLSKPNRHNGKEEAYERMRIIEESYIALLAESNAPVHFVSGQDIFLSHDPDMMTVDGTHPTDLGFHAMAEALSDIFALYFKKQGL